MLARRVNAVLIDSSDTALLARFYKEALGLPLEEERHGSGPHWACSLNGAPFAIHQREGLSGTPRNVSLSFEVDNVDRAASENRATGAAIELEPIDRPYGRLAAIRDLDGNTVYLHNQEKEKEP